MSVCFVCNCMRVCVCVNLYDCVWVCGRVCIGERVSVFVCV